MAESEVIVIGGGIAGASTAYFLAKHGRRVTLLERGEIASEASGVNAGGIGAYGWGQRQLLLPVGVDYSCRFTSLSCPRCWATPVR